MRTPASMMQGSYTLPGLNEYTITEKKFRVPGDPLPPMSWNDFYSSLRDPLEYHIGATVEGVKPIYLGHPRPTDVEVQPPESGSDYIYQLIWNDDPEYVPD